MRVSYNWLKEYVDFDLSPSVLAEKLTMSGFEVEEIIHTLSEFENIIVGEVVSCEKHPDAEKLSLCEVKIPDETMSVVCGAPNVAKGQKIPFAQVGVTLPGGMKIKKAKIRGVESYGMICSEEELGLAKKSDGILVLPNDWEIGVDVYEKLKTNEDYVIDLAITPNRPDALSMIGIAREVAAITGSKLKLPEFELKEIGDSCSDFAKIEIKNPDGCPRYAAKVIRNIKLAPSPKWIADRLVAAGIRPINNIVDITNYVLMELGQPLHAFDYNQISDATIIVRDSEPNEKFITLDEKERELPEQTVLICDKERAVAIGGIMGGLNSEVTDKTTTILLESAYFNPTRISRSSKKLGLSTEASQRFERGTDPNGVIFAANRAAYLMQKIAGGEILSGTIDNYPNQIKKKKIKVRVERINKVLGTNLSEKEIVDILTRLDIKYENGDVSIPTFRPDLEREVDIVEEIAQMITFDKIPVKPKTEIYYEFNDNPKDYFLSFIKKQFIELGLTETMSNSMITKDDICNDNWQDYTIPILNPVSDDMSVMRTSLLPSLLKTVAYNLNRNQKDIRIFELGRTFKKLNDKMESEQPYNVAGVINGKRYIEDWDTKSNKLDFYDIKGLIQSLIHKIFLDNVDLIGYDSHVYLDKNQTLALKNEDKIFGYFGKIKSSVLNHFDIESDVFGFELNIEDVFDIYNSSRQYKPFSKYPYVEKDLAFVFNNSVQAKNVVDNIFSSGKKLINSVDIFDLYKGENIGKANKSLAFRIRFQSNEKTLNDNEIDSIIKKIINRVESSFSAKLRD